MRFLMLNWRDPKNPMAGGAERVSQRFLKALQERGHDVCWFVNQYPRGSAEDVIDGVPVHRGGGKGTSVLAARKWYRKQPRFDLVIDQHHGIPWYAPWWCRTNCVAYIHEVLGPIWNSFYNWPWNTIGRWQEYRTHRLYRKIPFWVPSNSTKSELEARGVESVQMLPNGVDTLPLNDLPPKPFDSPIRLITVSRLANNKRVHHAVELVDRLKKKGNRVELTVIGSGDCEKQIRELIARLELHDAVHLRGRLSESQKNHLLAEAHFLVHPSVREGWGLNVIEANAMGTPALVYPVGGLVDSTIADVTGLVANEESSEALAAALDVVLTNRSAYEELRQNAWKRSFMFQWDEVEPAVCDWLEQQAARSR